MTHNQRRHFNNKPDSHSADNRRDTGEFLSLFRYSSYANPLLRLRSDHVGKTALMGGWIVVAKGRNFSDLRDRTGLVQLRVGDLRRPPSPTPKPMSCGRVWSR